MGGRVKATKILGMDLNQPLQALGEWLRDDKNFDAVVGHACQQLRTGMRYSFVAAYLGNKKFEEMYDEHQKYDVWFWLRNVVVCAIWIAAPWLYALLAMRDPCATHEIQLGNTTVTSRQIGCEAQSFLRSPWCLLL